MERMEIFDVTVPANTPTSATATTNLSFDIGDVIGLEVYVPPGPSGFMGFAFRHNNERVIPRTNGRFIIADGVTLRYELSNYPLGNKWSVSAYNTDVFDHFFQVRFLINETKRATSGSVEVVEIQQPNQEAPVDEGAPTESVELIPGSV